MLATWTVLHIYSLSLIALDERTCAQPWLHRISQKTATNSPEAKAMTFSEPWPIRVPSACGFLDRAGTSASGTCYAGAPVRWETSTCISLQGSDIFSGQMSALRSRCFRTVFLQEHGCTLAAKQSALPEERPERKPDEGRMGQQRPRPWRQGSFERQV